MIVTWKLRNRSSFFWLKVEAIIIVVLIIEKHVRKKMQVERMITKLWHRDDIAQLITLLLWRRSQIPEPVRRVQHSSGLTTSADSHVCSSFILYLPRNPFLIKPPENGHLRRTFLSPRTVLACMQFNPWNTKTSLIWTLSSVPLVSGLWSHLVTVFVGISEQLVESTLHYKSSRLSEHLCLVLRTQREARFSLLLSYNSLKGTGATQGTIFHTDAHMVLPLITVWGKTASRPQGFEVT